MNVRGLAVTAGIGAAAGAVAIMMMPRNNPARKLACQAADKVETAACKATEKMKNKMDM